MSLRPVDEIALLTRRAMHEYGYTRDHLANVALAFRKHANRNPNATMGHKELTREQYMDARWISEPLCLFDNCLETDGALAIVITSAERARDLRQPPAYVHAFAQSIPQQHQVMTNYFNDDPLLGPSWACARLLWERSDIQPADVPVAQLYDAFSPLVPLSLEGYGFCARGEGGAFTDDGALEWPNGRLPDEHRGRRDVRGVRPRLQPRARRRPPVPRHLDGAGRGRRVVPGHERRRCPRRAQCCSADERRTRPRWRSTWLLPDLDDETVGPVLGRHRAR